MGMLFDCSTDNIGLHLKNIFASGELEKDSVTEKISATYWLEKTMNWRTDICWWIHLKNGLTGQVPHKYRISTGQAQDKCVTYKIDGALIGKRNRIIFTD